MDDLLGDPPGEPRLELLPGLRRVAGLDRFVGHAGHLPDPGPQVVVDVGLQVDHAVGERLLPLRHAALQPLGLGLELGEVVDHPLGFLGVVEGIALAAELALEQRGDGDDVVHGRPHAQLLGVAGDLVLEVPRQLGEARLAVELAVVGPQGVHPQRGRHAQDLGRDPLAGQVVDVEVADLAPRRVEVGLGEHAHHVGAHAAGGLQEIQLGTGELLAGVGDEHHGVRQGQRPDGGGAVGRAQSPDAGGVDDHEPVAEQLAGQGHLDRADPALAGDLGRLGDVAGDLVDRDGLADRLAGGIGQVATRVEQDGRGGRVAVADGGGHRRGDVVVDGAHGCVEQGVDQRRLALLELADDEHVEGGVGEALAREREPAGQVGTVVRRARLSPEVDYGQCLLDGRRPLAGVGVPRHVRSSLYPATLTRIEWVSVHAARDPSSEPGPRCRCVNECDQATSIPSSSLTSTELSLASTSIELSLASTSVSKLSSML